MGVPVTTVKFAVFDEPPPGAGFVTTNGKAPVAARSGVDRAIEICDALPKLTVWAKPW